MIINEVNYSKAIEKILLTGFIIFFHFVVATGIMG